MIPKGLQEFIANPPSTIKVHDKGLRKNLILVLTDEGDRYMTKRNMGTAYRKVWHYWSFERAYECRV